jgi:hypothetical protein
MNLNIYDYFIWVGLFTIFVLEIKTTLVCTSIKLIVETNNTNHEPISIIPVIVYSIVNAILVLIISILYLFSKRVSEEKIEPVWTLRNNNNRSVISDETVVV